MDHTFGDSLEESHVGSYSQPDVPEKSTRNGQMDTPLQLHLLQQEAAHWPDKTSRLKQLS